MQGGSPGRDPIAIADFMESVLEFVPEADREPYQALIDEVRSGQAPAVERLAEAAKNLAAVTWPARRGLQRFLSEMGAEIEWEAVLEAVRPTTATLLKRLRKHVGVKTLDETLADPQASYAIHEREEIEISMVRQEVQGHLWEEHQEALAPLVDEAKSELGALRKRLKLLREQAPAMRGQEELARAKVDAFEDRVYFGGEAIPLEVLDAELAFDREDREIPATDDAL